MCNNLEYLLTEMQYASVIYLYKTIKYYYIKLLNNLIVSEIFDL